MLKDMLDRIDLQRLAVATDRRDDAPQLLSGSPSRVELKQTHMSYVFLAGEYVYKIKKPVHFDFADCSTLGVRYELCWRRGAPESASRTGNLPWRLSQSIRDDGTLPAG